LLIDDKNSLFEDQVWEKRGWVSTRILPQDIEGLGALLTNVTNAILQSFAPFKYPRNGGLTVASKSQFEYFLYHLISLAAFLKCEST